MSDERYYIGNPLCGDIWKLSDGRYLLVDFKDSLNTGFVTSDGAANGFSYTQSFENFLKARQAVLFLRSEDSGFPWCDSRGWGRGPATHAESLAFLRGVIERGGKGEDAPCALNGYNFAP